MLECWADIGKILFKEESTAVREAIKTDEFSMFGEIIKSKKNSKNNKSKFVTEQDVELVLWPEVSCLAFFSSRGMPISFLGRFLDFNGSFNWNIEGSFTQPCLLCGT